jgi:hypothetical protein
MSQGLRAKKQFLAEDGYPLESGQCCFSREHVRKVKCGRAVRAMATPGGLRLDRNLRVPMLEREVATLQDTVKALMGLINRDELSAARRLKQLTPDNATLKLWVERSTSHPELAAGPEERPW